MTGAMHGPNWIEVLSAILFVYTVNTYHWPDGIQAEESSTLGLGGNVRYNSRACEM